MILALDDEERSQVRGFALHLPSRDDAEVCTLAYMATKASHRRRGIARALLQRMVEHRPYAERGRARLRIARRANACGSPQALAR